ncbi:reverse transcriptase domain, reverse transcriptase zinc-binding domain protein [Tanacetum coccineum]|uniref:Reverse transcriptase domain, reverse transcriptase zinc-binding domain protein n=1 Tax=Tanacetum coccineum TaxID=301880 RepID=A0ABQ5CH01_9ASTR
MTRGWRKILQIRPIIRKFIWYKIGNGSSISAWFDSWSMHSPVIQSITPQNIHAAGFSMQTTLADVVSQNAWEWPLEWVNRYPFIFAMTVPSLNEDNDQVVWKSRLDIIKPFSVGTVWDDIRHHGNIMAWMYVIWFGHCIPRHAFNLWTLWISTSSVLSNELGLIEFQCFKVGQKAFANPCARTEFAVLNFSCRDGLCRRVPAEPKVDSNKDECLTQGDDIQFLFHHDPSKCIASILVGFIDDPLFEENDDLFDSECKTNYWKGILYDTPINEAECFDPGGDNDKIDAFLAIEVPTYIKEGYYDSEGDVLYLESLLSDDTTHNLSPEVFFDHEPQHIENESDHVTFSPKSDPLHYEFTGELITIPPGIVREHEDYINRMSLLCGNSSSWSLEKSHTIIESLPISTTLFEDSDPNREEIDIFSGPDDSIPSGTESDFDSEEDIIDNLLKDDPIPKHERLTFDIEPDVVIDSSLPSLYVNSRLALLFTNKINNGKSTSMWFDKWHDLCLIQGMLTARDITRSGFGLSESVSDLIANGNLRPFSVASAWDSLRSRADVVDWFHVVWFPQCIPRHAFHIWLVTKQTLKTQDTLRQWDIIQVITSMVRMKLVSFKFKKVSARSWMLLDQWKISSCCMVHEGSSRARRADVAVLKVLSWKEVTRHFLKNTSLQEIKSWIYYSVLCTKNTSLQESKCNTRIPGELGSNARKCVNVMNVLLDVL